MKKPKILRIATVPQSLSVLLKGQLGYMNQYFEVVGIASKEKSLDEVSRQEGIRVIGVNMTRTISPVKDVKAFFILCLLILRERPVIVHTHSPKAGILGMLSAWICRVPVRMHTVAGLPLIESRGIKRLLLRLVEKIVYACATKVYPNSLGLQDFILNEGLCPVSKLKVIGNGSSNGIDADFFSRHNLILSELAKLKERYNIGDGDFVFLYIGRLVKDKGINELVKVFSTLKMESGKLKLILAGIEEPDLDPLETEVLEIMHNDNDIILTGWLDDVRPLFAISNILVFPSYREGLPNVPMQACCMDLPCIVTDINGCNEIIKHEYNGLLIPPKNKDSLLAAMKRVLTDKEVCEKMKSVARKSIVQRYDHRIIWEKIKEEYESQVANLNIGE